MLNDTWQPSLQYGDYEIKEDNLVYDGVFTVKRLQLRHRFFDGSWSPWIWREQLLRRNAAAVILYDPKQDKVVLVEQFRVGLVGDKNKQSPWMLEIVAGLIDEGESAQATVMREAIEEANCPIKQLHEIGPFYNTPGGFVEKSTIFLGICDAPQTGGIHGLHDEHEDIKVHVLSLETVLAQMAARQVISSASTVIALYWLQANRDRLNQLNYIV